jgi:predicted AlkP superfamily phosphohydrolase/phosphomutase
MPRLYVTLLCILLLVTAGCSGPDRPATDPVPILFLGLDGASPEVCARMAARGELPTLSALMEQGWSSRMETYIPTVSPLIWNSMATGKSWLRLGIHLADMKRGFRGTMLEPAPVWRVASREGKRVAVLNWWLTWPAEELNGHLLSDRAPYYLFDPPEEQRKARLTWPAEWIDSMDDLRRPKADASEIIEAFGLDPAMRDDIVAAAGYGEIQEHLARDKIVLQAARRLIAGDLPDFTAVLVRGLDVTQHGYWPNPGGANVAADSAVVGGAYRYYDRRLGELVEQFKARAPHGLILVVSDHGFRPRHELFQQQNRADLNVQALLGRLGLRDINAQGRVFRLRAVEQHSFAREVFIEAREITEDPKEKTGRPVPEEIINQVIRGLSGLETSDGKPFFLDPRPAQDLEWCHVRADVNPDIRQIDTMDTREGPVTLASMGMSGIRPKSIPPGQHFFGPDGIFIGAGPGLPTGGSFEKPALIAVADVGPTLLTLMGIPPARDMDGRPCTALLGEMDESDFVESYDHLAAAGGAVTDDDSGLDERRKEEYRALGYIE